MKKTSILIFLILFALYGASSDTSVSYKGSLESSKQEAKASIIWNVAEISSISLWFDLHEGYLEQGHSDTPQDFSGASLATSLLNEFGSATNEDVYLHCRVRGNANAKLSIRACAPMTSPAGGEIDWGISEKNGSVDTGIGNYDFVVLMASVEEDADINLSIATESLDNATLVMGDNRYSSNMEVKVEIV